MCGIAGIVSSEPVVLKEVQTMIDALRHRGPDDEGLFAETNVALGHRRLSILDLSPLGHQPMLTPDGRFCIVFNGEIYNFREIRNRLTAKGHSFRSQTDTEVILAAYREFGLDCLAHLRGMFAFAIWDAAKKTLFVARDRLGKKPVYFFANGRRLAFASEIRALLCLPWIPRDLSPLAVDAYFALQYVPAPMTVFRGISKLPPGHFLVAEDFGERLYIQRYWPPADAAGVANENVPVEEIDRLIREAVGLRLIADVDVGVLLSGGIDSSLITAIAAQGGGKRLKTFSVGFRQESLNELPQAEVVARRFGTEHHAIVVDDVTPAVLENVIEHMDEPLGDPACIPTYQIAEFASRHVKVVMSGEGADELFGGYRYYAWERLFAVIGVLPSGLREWLSEVLAGSGGVQRLFFVDRLAKVLESRPEASVARWMTVFSRSDRRRYFSPEFLEVTEGSDPLESIYRASARSTTRDRVARGLEVDLQTWLPDDLLMKVDKMTMASSLEARTPFLDHRLVESVTSCGISLKVRGTKTKVLLKKLAARYLPEEITERQKHGFEVPVRSWLLGNFRELAEDCFGERRLREVEFLDGVVVRKDWRRFVEAEGLVSPRKIWLLFCFLQWDRKSRTAPAALSSLALGKTRSEVGTMERAGACE